jgi:putative membrane protein
MMACLTGFMIGSLKKIWPWKEVLESKVIRGKTHVLNEVNIIPDQINSEVFTAIALMILGFILVFAIERLSQKD